MNASAPLQDHARRTPDAQAYVGVDGTAVTYAVLERTVNFVARRALEAGLAPGQTTALAANDLYRYLVTALALARIGVTFAPISLPAQWTDVALLDAGATGNGAARTLELRALWPDDITAVPASESVPMHDGGDAILMICPSSGTTGARKFVPISHALSRRRVQARAPVMLRAMGAQGLSALRLASLIGSDTSFGFSSMLLVLGGGGAVLEPNLNADTMDVWLARSKVNYIVASPISLQQIVDALSPLRGPDALAALEIGGGILPAPVYERVCQRLCRNITISYGLTECGSVAGAPAAALQGKPRAVGYAHPGVEIVIVDDDGAPVAAGQEGIVRIRSDRSATGYLGNPDAGADVFREGWVYPGDRGMLDADGLLRITGRTDDVINRGGNKINPLVIEDRMMALGEIQEVAVFGVPGAVYTSICAAIVPIAPLDADTYHARCREHLGADAPVLIMHMQQLPRNAAGKVLRHELANIALAAARRQSAPR